MESAWFDGFVDSFVISLQLHFKVLRNDLRLAARNLVARRDLTCANCHRSGVTVGGRTASRSNVNFCDAKLHADSLYKYKALQITHHSFNATAFSTPLLLHSKNKTPVLGIAILVLGVEPKLR